MRGYRVLKDSNALGRIADVKWALTNRRFDIREGHFSKYIFGAGVNQAEIVCRQYLLLRVAGLELNRALLHALGKAGAPVVFYLPPAWRKTVQEVGFKIAPLRSALLWNAFVVRMLAYGVLRIGRIILDGIKAALKKSHQQSGSYVYFADLAPGNLPQPSKDGRSHDIITWYMQWAGRETCIDALCHGVAGSGHSVVNGTPVVPVPGPVPPLTSLGALSCFAAWGIGAIALATLDFMRGRWWHALMLNPAALAAQMRLQEADRLAREYLFHNSGWIYRPLWTYEAEKRGARITCYSYSTNNEPFKRSEGYPPHPYGWQAMNWPHYLVWDDYHANFIRRAVGDTGKIDVVGPIWFQCSAMEMPAIEGKCVAVFDVTPFRSSRYQILGAPLEFYVPEICMAFLQDIQKITYDAGYSMLWKRKRKIGSLAHPRYRLFEERFSEVENVIIVDQDISAYRVIEKSTAVISLPFTSTALIARQLGKPACYYDPSGMVQKDDRAAHGIEIVSGPEELSVWLRNIPD
ncbi:polysaccharide biosynthesis PFTS motif protein [bacterium]|nr:MAG: polysaccharide biosynthesis PFTS motif protein [bacterium]